MNPMVNPGMAQVQPPAPVQSPQSQYLTAALNQLGTQPITGGAPQLGMNMLADGLMEHSPYAQRPEGQAQPGLMSKLGGLFGLGQNDVQGAANSQVTI